MADYRFYLDRVLSIKVKDEIFNGGIFNGLEYQVVTNPITGRQWLDRNLGATRVATAVNDAQAYGHLFQWGRLADGHEIRTSATRNEQSTTDVPGHSDFIIGFDDWRNPSNNNLWQGVDAVNGIAPKGWRLPTESELMEERNTWTSFDRDGAYASFLKLPRAGLRSSATGSFSLVGVVTRIWSMNSVTNSSNSRTLNVGSSSAAMLSESRAEGRTVRLIKDI